MATNERRITAGFYRRFDGHHIYVVDVVKNIDTGEDYVICKHDSHSERDYFVISKASFCETVNGKKKYARATNRIKAGNLLLDEVDQDGYRKPIRRTKTVALEADCRQDCKNYIDYAKDILYRYREDVRLYNLSTKEHKLLAVNINGEFAKLKEDIMFVKHIFDTVLKDEKDFFKDIFLHKMSIRTYATVYNINRGSVVYRKDKLVKKVAALLEARDIADGKSRLSKYS